MNIGSHNLVGRKPPAATSQCHSPVTEAGGTVGTSPRAAVPGEQARGSHMDRFTPSS